MTAEQEGLMESRKMLLRMKEEINFFSPWPDLYGILFLRYSSLSMKQVALEQALQIQQPQGFGFVPLIIAGAAVAVSTAVWAIPSITDWLKHKNEVVSEENRIEAAKDIIEQGGSTRDATEIIRGDNTSFKVSDLVGWGLLALGGALALSQIRKLSE